MTSDASYVPNELESRLERFDQCWHRGDRPAIEDFLPPGDSHVLDDARRYQLLVELVMIDLEYRWRQGGTEHRDTAPGSTDTPAADSKRPDRPLLEDYVRRYGELGPLGELPARLIADEYRVRQRWGDTPGTDEYLRRFERQAEGLRAELQRIRRRLQVPKSSSDVHIRCPHCHGPVELVAADFSDVTCRSCGSHFNLLGHEDQADHRGGTKWLGHFELLEQIGTGSFGSVWKARDSELDRLVAIKIPRRGRLAPNEVQQFLREARAAAQLRHPNIVPVHEVGREKDTIYIASDYVEGCTLEELMQDHRLTGRESAQLCAEIAEALDHAHQAGVVHRDLKPSNIMIDTDGQPHLMDFGLARREAGEITMTLEGKVLGTPAYMSPEQAKGESHHADQRSDLYSLGVVFFELLTGEKPFRGNLRMLLHHVIHDDAPSLRRLNSRIHRDLETICLKCLEKDPRKRYGTAQELADELGRFLKGEPIRARPISAVARTSRWCRRNPLLATFATTAASLLLFLGVAGPLVAVNQASLARKAAGEAESRRRQLYLSDVIVAQQAWEAADVGRVVASLKRHLPQPGQKDLRGFEWYYLWRLCRTGETTQTLEHHEGIVGRIAFSPDGTTLAAAASSTLSIWTLATGKGLTLAHRGPTLGLAFSPDGNMLATGSSDGTLKLWHLDGGKEPTILNKENPFVGRCVAFCADGTLLATNGPENEVLLWNVHERRVLHTLGGHERFVECVAFSPDGTMLASASHETVRLWDLSSREACKLQGHQGRVLHGSILSGWQDVGFWGPRPQDQALGRRRASGESQPGGTRRLRRLRRLFSGRQDVGFGELGRHGETLGSTGGKGATHPEGTLGRCILRGFFARRQHLGFGRC